MADSSFSLAHSRHTSLRQKARPKTACSIPVEIKDFSSRRHSMIMPSFSEMSNGFELQQDTDWPRRSGSLSTPAFVYESGLQGPHDPFQQIAQPNVAFSAHFRRSQSISHSIKSGVSELRSLGRRMSASMRGKNNKGKQEVISMTEALSSTCDGFRDNRDPWHKSFGKSQAKAWFRVPTTRRRPSLPLLNNTRADESLRFHIVGPIPGSRHGPPLLPDNLLSGAGARAAAAAQNEALQSTHKLSILADLEIIQSQTSDMKLTRDSESGIGIDMHQRRESVGSSVDVARLDPTRILPTELMEQIFRWLDSTSVLRAQCVSRQWRMQASSMTVWRNIFFREYEAKSLENSWSSTLDPRSTAGLGKKIPNQDWQKMFHVRRAIDERWVKGEAAAIYLNGHKDSVYCVQFDEQKIITGSRDRTIRVWDTHTYQCVKKIGPPLSPLDRTELDLDPVNPQGVFPLCSIVSSSPDPSGGNAPKDYHNASILCLQYDKEILVTGSSDFTCIVWSIKDNYKPIRRLRGHTAGVLDVCIDARYIITCSKDTTIVVWDRNTGELLKRLAGHRGPVNAVQMRGNLLASASGDGMAKLWNLDGGVCIKEFSSKDRGLACVEFSEDGRSIFAGGNDQVIYEYDTGTGGVVRQLRGHKSLVRSLHLDSTNDRIVSGSYDMSVKVWDGREGSHSGDGGLKINFEGWTTSWMLAAKSDYRKIVCTSQDGRVVIIDFGYGIEGVEMLEA